ncbi:hypothetical protein D3C87_1019470 [compost metagenome]
MDRPSSVTWFSTSHGDGSTKYGSPSVRTSAWIRLPRDQPARVKLSISLPLV